MEIFKLKQKYMSGEEVSMNVRVKNLSRTKNYFILSSELISNIDEKRIPNFISIIYPKKICDFNYSFTLSNKKVERLCELSFKLYTKSFNKEKLLLTKINSFAVSPDLSVSKSTKPVPVEVKITTPVVEIPVRPLGSLKITANFVDVHPEINFNELLKLNVFVKNLSKYYGKVIAEVQILPSVILPGIQSTAETMSQEIELLPESTSYIIFDYPILETKLEGEYLVNLVISQLDNKNKPQGVLAKDGIVISIIDRKPEIILNNFQDTIKKVKTISYSAYVTDDKGVNKVNFCSKIEEKNKTECFEMKLSTGTILEGTWEYTTKIRKKIKKLVFFISATDTKAQETVTQDFIISIEK